MLPILIGAAIGAICGAIYDQYANKKPEAQKPSEPAALPAPSEPVKTERGPLNAPDVSVVPPDQHG